MSEALSVSIERPEVDDRLWVSRNDWTVEITVTADDCDNGTATVGYPMTPEDARIVAHELLWLAREIDGREP